MLEYVLRLSSIIICFLDGMRLIELLLFNLIQIKMYLFARKCQRLF
jgi:hypothetical protein